MTTNKDKLQNWTTQGQPIIVLETHDLKHMKDIAEKAEETGVHVSVVHDAGRTEVASGTPTTVAFGPDADKKINKITGGLRTLK